MPRTSKSASRVAARKSTHMLRWASERWRMTSRAKRFFCACAAFSSSAPTPARRKPRPSQASPDKQGSSRQGHAGPQRPLHREWHRPLQQLVPERRLYTLDLQRLIRCRRPSSSRRSATMEVAARWSEAIAAIARRFASPREAAAPVS